MTESKKHQPDPNLDLVMERIVDVPRELVWKAWTTPSHLVKWFTPAPWKTVDCEIDLRPGGIFRTVMLSPEGQEFPNLGCYLEIVENEKLVWTNAMAPGYRPCVPVQDVTCGPFLFTAVIALESHGSGTKYTATVIHGDERSRKQHEEMGFHDGWGKALDQLVAMVKEGR
ncbi:SRPBCC family protein [Fimbriimonas ginsengisoli]|uniref:Putative glutathione S-transferase-related transmembrane protein n=1 Tax=Fimbriimonas ginsengisoli Gsoil 348 TaxID=661478 RepID=A0A068NMK3_FIMGI|nr:SRPBCC family protein [Fimbriimonas ginsengisoli]AIE84607.1 putative glutathione S-transferase-related transmembrane protein [Fimbriimonas ginsengisoli Gsoil 348]